MKWAEAVEAVSRNISRPGSGPSLRVGEQSAPAVVSVDTVLCWFCVVDVTVVFLYCCCCGFSLHLLALFMVCTAVCSSKKLPLHRRKRGIWQCV